MRATPAEWFAARRAPEFMIHWAERPETLPFVRVSVDFVSRRERYPLKRYRGHNYRVVGHAMLKPLVTSDGGRFQMRIFTVRDYDATPADGGFIPAEAVDPLTLAPNVAGHRTDRCRDGHFPRRSA
jgi:hypothetical protein